jgi:hypothetical protein
MNLGRTVFAQLIELLPRRAFDLAVERRRTSGRPLTLSCMDQLLCMIFAQLTGRSSLRETVTCLRALGPRRYHLGIRHPPARSTLADANERRDARIFMDAALSMIASTRAELPVDPDLRRLGVRGAAFALDSTTIDLCLALFPWARFKRTKGAIKAHVLLDLQVGLPVFMRISHAKTSDISTLDRLTYLPGAFYVLDRGYVDFARLHRLSQAGAFFVTRPKRKMKFRVQRRFAADAGRGITGDRLIRLTGQTMRRRGLRAWPIRLIRYVDPLTGKRLSFLTNHLTLDAWRVALLYRKRWKIELLFKWMKQHLHVKAFFGTTPNAVKSQLWIAVITLVLIHRLKQRLGLRQTPNEIAQILSVTLCEKTPVNQAFLDDVEQNVPMQDHNQMMLFEL